MTPADRDITLGTVGIRKLPTYGIGQISNFYNFAIPHHRPEPRVVVRCRGYYDAAFVKADKAGPYPALLTNECDEFPVT